MSQSKALILLCHRTKEKAAYMMWPCSNRWAIFCQREGIDAALSMLQAMVQDLQVPSCTNRHPEAAVGHQCCLPKSTPFANSRHEILRLLQVVSTSKSGEWEGVARSRTFQQLRYAFALPLENMEKDIARVHITRKLKVGLGPTQYKMSIGHCFAFGALLHLWPWACSATCASRKAVITTVAVALFSKFKSTPPAMCLSRWLTLACMQTFEMSILQRNCLIYTCVSLTSPWRTHGACSTKPKSLRSLFLLACLIDCLLA